MNKLHLIGFLILTVFVSACEVHQSVNKDLETGAFTRENGIGCDDVQVEINEVVENRNKFVFGEKVKFVFNDIKGLAKENGIVYPGLSVCVVKNETDTVLFNENLLGEDGAGFDYSPLALYAAFLAIFPCEDDEQYLATINMWDKNGDGTLMHQMPFTIEKNQVLSTSSASLTSSDIYLWNESKQLVVVNKELDKEDEYILIFEELDGFTTSENRVYPALSIALNDGSGTSIMSYANVLAEVLDEGVDPEQLRNDQVYALITLSSDLSPGPYTLRAALTDTNSESRIDVEGELVVK